MRDYWVKLLRCWGWAHVQTFQAVHCASAHVQFFLIVLKVFQGHAHVYIQVLADISSHATRPVAPF